MGMLKNGVSGVLGPLPCSRTHPYAPRAKAPSALLITPSFGVGSEQVLNIPLALGGV